MTFLDLLQKGSYKLKSMSKISSKTFSGWFLILSSTLSISLWRQETLAPRAARNVRTYAEDTPVGRKNRKRRAPEAKERPNKRSAKAVDHFVAQSAPLDGAAVRVSQWMSGNLSKKDATAFVKAVGPQNTVVLRVSQWMSENLSKKDGTAFVKAVGPQYCRSSGSRLAGRSHRSPFR